MPPYITKATFFYEYKGRGITENLYSSGDASATRGKVADYLTKRLAFADDDMTATYVRLSDGVHKNRVEFISLANLPGFTGQIVEPGCSPTDAILAKFLGQAREPSRMFLHCFPASFLKEEKVVPKGKWFQQFQAWVDYLTVTANGWVMINSSGNTIPNRRPITSVTAISPRGYRVVVDDLGSLAAGDYVHIGNVGGDCVGVKGRKVVQSVTTGDVKSFIVGGVKPVGTVAAGAYYVKLAFAQTGFARGEAARLTEHKVGKPFALPVGRQATTLSLRR